MKRLPLILIFVTICIQFTATWGFAAEKKMPVRVQAVLIKAQEQMVKEQYAQAADILQKFRSQGEGDEQSIYEYPDINNMLGNCLLLTEKYSQAAAAYRRVLKQEKTNATAWQNLGRCEYELQHLEEASRCFLKAYESGDPPTPNLLYQSAACLLMAKKYQQSIALFEQLLKAHPQEIKPEWKESLVYALLALDKNRQALPYIKQLSEEFTGKKQRQWREILLQQYLVLNMYKEAETICTSFTRIEPNEPLWWKCMTHICLQQGRAKRALKALTIYSYLTPLTLEEKKLAADLNMQIGVPAKAVPQYESYLAQKQDTNVLKRLVQAYTELGNNDKALSTIKKYDPNGKETDLALLSGQVLYREKRFADAAESFSNAAAHAKNKAGKGQAYMMKGYCYWQMNKPQKSISAFQKAARCKRYKEKAEEIIRKLEEEQRRIAAVSKATQTSQLEEKNQARN